MLVNVKQPHYRPEQALRVPEVWGYQISRQSAHEGDKVVSPNQRPPLSPRKYSWYSFLLEVESIPGPRGGRKNLCQWKILMTPSGIELTTFQLVAHCTTACRRKHTCSRLNSVSVIYLHNTGGDVFCGTTARIGLRPARSEFSRSRTIRHTYLWARHKGRYIHNLQHAQGTNIYVLSGIRTHDPNNLAIEGLSLRSQRYRDCHCVITTPMFI
jgi:hypothetical protein